MGVHEVMRKLATDRRVLPIRRDPHDRRHDPAEAAKMRELDWLWDLQARLSKVENFTSWRDIATAAMFKHDDEMIPTAEDTSRDMYMYRLHRYSEFKLGRADRKPKPMVPQSRSPHFRRTLRNIELDHD